jgi:hypothetical protein
MILYDTPAKRHLELDSRLWQGKHFGRSLKGAASLIRSLQLASCLIVPVFAMECFTKRLFSEMLLQRQLTREVGLTGLELDR